MSGGWSACRFILVSLSMERLAYYAVMGNLVVYISKKLTVSKANAANSVSNWMGTCNLTPLLGGFLADSYMGRFSTINAFFVLYLPGMVLLMLSACSVVSSQKAMAILLYTALYTIAVGSGGPRSCISAFGAFQLDESDAAGKTSFFNWSYFSTNVGGLVAGTAFVYIQQDVSWLLGFAIPTIAVGLSCIVFYMGSPLYKHQQPGGSPLARVAQVFVAAARNRNSSITPTSRFHELQGASEHRQIQHTNGFRFLDKAAIISQDVDPNAAATMRLKWQLCTVTQVEEVKVILRLVPIWATSIVFSTVFIQTSTLFVQQGGQMQNSIASFRVPPASLAAFDTIAVILVVPLYDRHLVPLLQKLTGQVQGLTDLQRMGFGLFLSMVGMCVAALVELYSRLHRAKGEMVSIFWQVPQYFIVGAAGVFAIAGRTQFFNEGAPDAMRSLISAFSLTTNALGNYLSTLLVLVVDKITSKSDGRGSWIDEHIDYFFWVLAFLVAMDLSLFITCVRNYRGVKPEVHEVYVEVCVLEGCCHNASKENFSINQSFNQPSKSDKHDTNHPAL